MTGRAFVFDVGNGDGHRLGVVTHRAALGDVRVRDRLGQTFFALGMHNRGGQSGFAMVNVTNRADVDVRFRSLKLLFSHFILLRLCFVLARYVLMEPMIRIELMTSSLPRTCSTN